MSQAVTDLEQQWRELFVRHAKVSEALERELQRGHDVSVTELEALERLAERDEDGCRLQQLVDDVHMSQSALSRLVSRLEAKGLVERKSCSQDRRGIYAHLTVAGRERLEEARPTRQRVLAEQL
jgi:DNA-binding MarR family transcriptional regulator